ncbi:hypothetical protein [Hellea balneolensis]|uniref:hypothetical protein n=1 Tax=Hellea balneolensis TaxID=287478 RepID=UPI00040FBDFE|nr:hypothetical protein [Hellea balneolensis]
MIEPRKPVAAFDFNVAAGGAFQTLGGKDFVIRLWFWMSAGLSIVFIVTLPLFIGSYGEVLEQSWLSNRALFSGNEQPNPDAMLSAFGKIIPGMLLFTLGLWVVTAAGETALYRRYFHDQEAPRQPLRFGRQELRTMLCQLSVWLLVFLVYILGVFAITLVIVLFSALSPILAGIFGFVAIFALIAMFVFIPVRLAPAAALSMQRDKTHVLAANKVTKYRFWNLFVAYLVTYLGGYIGYYIIYMISVGIATGDMGFLMAVSGLGEDNPRVLFDAAAERMKSPLGMLLGVLAMIVNAAALAGWILLVAGVNCYAVRWWTKDDPVPNF